MTMRIRISANNKSARGPGKVYQNLTAGLIRCGHVVTDSNPDITVCLQAHHQMSSLDKKTTIFGPNIVDMPADLPAFYSDSQRNFVTQSKWIRDLYSKFDYVNMERVWAWPVGIDTDTWKPSQETPTQDCFIYFKNRSKQELLAVQATLESMGITHSVLTYGNYNEAQLKAACAASKFAILLTNTETQGIAYMEILSTNTPCYVLDMKQWVSRMGMVTCEATSVPYFNHQCGHVSPCAYLDKDEFSGFLNRLGTYQPRTYIANNHTLARSAANLVNILNEMRSK